MIASSEIRNPKASVRMRRPVMRDDDGRNVGAGDKIRFCYGIPSVIVIAEIVEHNGKLVALTPGHHPASCSLRRLRHHVGMWFKHNDQIQP